MKFSDSINYILYNSNESVILKEYDQFKRHLYYIYNIFLSSPKLCRLLNKYDNMIYTQYEADDIVAFIRFLLKEHNISYQMLLTQYMEPSYRKSFLKLCSPDLSLEENNFLYELYRYNIINDQDINDELQYSEKRELSEEEKLLIRQALIEHKNRKIEDIKTVDQLASYLQTADSINFAGIATKKMNNQLYTYSNVDNLNLVRYIILDKTDSEADYYKILETNLFLKDHGYIYIKRAEFNGPTFKSNNNLENFFPQFFPNAVIILLGADVCKQFALNDITQIHGTYITQGSNIIVPLIHPKSILKKKKQNEFDAYLRVKTDMLNLFDSKPLANTTDVEKEASAPEPVIEAINIEDESSYINGRYLLKLNQDIIDKLGLNILNIITLQSTNQLLYIFITKDSKKLYFKTDYTYEFYISEQPHLVDNKYFSKEEMTKYVVLNNDHQRRISKLIKENFIKNHQLYYY